MISRRTFGGAALAAAAFPWAPGCARLVQDSFLEVPAELAELVEALEQAHTRRQTVDAAGEHLTRGGTVDALYLALQLACCRQLPFDQLGFAAHPLWMLGSARELASRGNGQDTILAALHAADLFKLMHREARGYDRIGPGPLGTLPDPDPAALERAVDEGDRDGADLAAAALFRAGDLEGLRQALLRSSLRNVANIGHTQIHAAQAIRVSDAVGWDESVARLVAWALAQDVTLDFAVLEPWKDNQARADALPAGWDQGADDPAGALALLPRLRTRRADDAAEAVAEALTSGLGVGSVMDALGVRASELSLSQIGLDGVFPGLHSVTGMDACRFLLATAADDATRRRVVLQAAALIATNDAEGADRSNDRQGDVRLDELEPERGATAAEVLRTADDDRMAAARQLLGLVDADGPAALVAEQLALAQRATVDDHHFKLPVAAWLCAEAADPSLAGAVLAGSLAWGPTAGERDWDLLDRAREIAERAG